MQSEISGYKKGTYRGMEEGACYTVKSLARSVRLECGVGSQTIGKNGVQLMHFCIHKIMPPRESEKIVLPFSYGLVVLVARWVKQGTD